MRTARTTCQAEVSFANPAQLEVAKTHSPTDPDPLAGQQVTYTVTVTNPGNSATGSGTFSDPLPDPPLDAAGATWTCTRQHRVDVRGAAGEPLTGTGVAERRADHGGPQRRHGDVHHHRHHPGQRGPGDGPQRRVGHARPGTECADGQPTCDGEDTFTADTDPGTAHHHQDPRSRRAPTQGQPFTYTITVTNTSTTTQAEGTVDDPFDSPALTGITWTAAATGGSSVSPDRRVRRHRGRAGGPGARGHGHLHRARHRARRLARRGRDQHLRRHARHRHGV